MEKGWLIVIAILIFLGVTFIYWRLSFGPFKKKHGKNHRKIWGLTTFYWQEAILLSTAVTMGILFLLKEVNILTF